MKMFLTLIILLIGFPIAAHADEPPSEPILRIETGMHTAAIRGVAIDDSSRWLVTASEDKTVRVWDLKNADKIGMKSVRTIRPPIGNEWEGKLYSVAISPDGETIVCGGLTGTWDKASTTIYIFNRINGILTGRITGLPQTITHLAFSPDGRYLAATLSSRGIVIFDSNDWSEIARDFNYGARSPSAHFSNDGRLVTTSLDGYVRLYQLRATGKKPRLEHIAMLKNPDGSKPYSARFSPDGLKVAVGYFDITRVSVLSGHDLSLLYTPDTSGVVNGFLGNVAWSADGKTLYAAGRWQKLFGKVWKVPIRYWSDGGMGMYNDTGVTDDAILGLVSLPNGHLAFVSFNTTLGLLNKSGIPTLFVPPVTVDFRNVLSKFLISSNGSQVSFSYETLGKSQVTFNLVTRSISLGAGQLKSSPITIAPNLDITGWKNTTEVKLKGTRLEIEPYEISRSLAIVPDGNSFILGTEWRLLRFDPEGKLIWQLPATSVVWKVNVAANNTVVVAAYGDGTIRWHRMSDGRELVAFLPHTDQKRWVLWTPEGYFDASPGGAELIGYHINQGRAKEAKFVPMSYLYDVFYRPDIVQAKFRGEDIAPLISLTATEALKTPAPEVKITSIPATSADKNAKVCYRIASTGGGIGEVRLFQNGKLIKSDGFYREAAAMKEPQERMQLASLNSRAIYQEQRSLVVREKNASGIAISKPKGELVEECVEIEPAPGENEVSVAAFNAPNTVQSFMDTATFRSTRPPEEPHLYILAVGIDKYRDSSINLKYAAKDSKDFIAQLPEKARSIYKPKNIHLISLTDTHAGKQGIQKAIDNLAAKVKHGDGFIFFNASHGVLLQNQYYIVTADFNGNLDNTATLISSNEIIEMSKRIKALSQLFIFDTCHAGGVDTIVSGLYDARMVNLARKMGLHVFASAGSVQTAMDGYKGNGLYTYTLLQGLKHGKDVDKNKSGVVTIKALGEYTKLKTSEISEKLGHQQIPAIINFGQDTLLYRVK